MPPVTAPTPSAPRTPLALVAIGLYVALTLVLAAVIVWAVQTGRSGDGLMWFLLPPLAYAAGLAYGAWQLELRPEAAAWAPRWIYGLMAVHALAGLGGAFALGWLVFAGPLLHTAMGAMLLAALLALWLPVHARRSEAFVVAAFAGAGWLVAMLLLFL